MLNLKVKHGENSYPVLINSSFTEEIFNYKKSFLSNKICLFCDSNVIKYYHKEIDDLAVGETNFFYSITASEKEKNIKQISKLVDYLLVNKFNRDDTLVAIGGGITGDMGGFAASVLLRGINLVHVPTTLLAMVDSSIGGKTGVNHKTGKNLIGTFYQPKTVIMDLNFLKTLNKRQIRTGLSEVVKYGIISDPEILEMLENKVVTDEIDFSNINNWEKLIGKCVGIKADIVSKDEKENNLRMILNYGHTFGHAIETATKYKKYTHGEAVSIGMNIAAYLAFKINVCKKDLFLRQRSILLSFNLPVNLPKAINIDDIMSIIKVDKKVRNNKIKVILPEEFGKVRIVDDIEEGNIKKILKEITDGA